MMRKKTLNAGLVSVVLAMVLGAMGTHYLKETLGLPQDKIEVWQTGVLYQMFNGLGLVVLAILSWSKYGENVHFRWARLLVFVGMCLFSGSIYMLSLNGIWHLSWIPPVFGPTTPLGGSLMIMGWVLCILKFNTSKR